MSDVGMDFDDVAAEECDCCGQPMIDCTCDESSEANPNSSAKQR